MADWGFLAQLIFPGRCLLCGQWLPLAAGDGAPVCAECRSALTPLSGDRCNVCSMPLSSERGICMRCREARYTFDSNVSVFAYRGAVRRLITLYKFSGRTRLSKLFASCLAPVIGGRFPGRPVIPVPPRPHRRSLDAVERVARLLERDHGFALLRCLERTGTVQQKSLDFAERAVNLRGRIRVGGRAGRASVPAAAVLLDDVFTTGATADACSRALREAGCVSVSVVTLAMD